MIRHKNNQYKDYLWHRNRIEDQITQSLSLGNLPFRVYLATYHLTTLDVAHGSNVPYITTWTIEQGKPVSQMRAAMVRAGLLKMTGVAYMEPILTHSDW